MAQDKAAGEHTDKGLVTFIVSDGTGETVDTIVRAALTQYRQEQVRMLRYKSVRTADQVEAVLDEAVRVGAVLVYTAVSDVVRAALSEGVERRKGLLAVDLLGPLLSLFSKYLDQAPKAEPGLLHEVNEEYFRRIEAMEFAVKQDDGAHPENLRKADVILVGVSRTSKTPLSIYLSHKGYKVANVPLVRGIEVPPGLFEVEQGKIMALTIDPDALSKIRKERLLRMGRDLSGDYASLNHIRSEIMWANELFSRNRRWPVFDVTGKALEETASEIQRTLSARRIAPK